MEVNTQLQEYFSDLTFNEQYHKYYVKGEPIKKSVSKLIELYKYPTNWDLVLKRTAESRGITESELSAEWKAAADLGCAIGDKAHKFGEDYPLNMGMKPSTGYEEAIVKFWREMPDYIVPAALELQMYHKEFMYAGTTDIVLKDLRTNQYILADYKTNKDLFKNFNNQRMQKPFENFLCMSLNHYKLQLSFYQILIEQIPEVEVIKRIVVWIKPDGTYEPFIVEDLSDKLLYELKNKNIC